MIARAFVGALLSASSLLAQSPLRGANVLVSRESPYPNVETTIAANPKDARSLIGASIVSTPFMDRTTIYVSQDGGATWQSTYLHELADEGTGDPQVGFDADGTAYFSALGLVAQKGANLEKRMSVQVFRSPDKGVHWNQVAAYGSGAFTDHPQMVIDPVKGRGGLLVSALWDLPASRATELGIFRSTDRGDHFLDPIPVVADSTIRLFNLNPLLFSDGALFVPFARFRSGTVQSCPSFDIDAVIVDPASRRLSSERKVRHNIEDPNGCGGGVPYAKVAFGIDARRSPNRLFVLMNEGRVGRYALTLSHSDDRGETWSEAALIGSSVGEQFRPAIVVNDSGVIGVSWCATKDSTDRRWFAQYFAASYDGGSTFSPPVLVSSEWSPLKSAGNDVPGHTINSPAVAADGTVSFAVHMAASFADAGEYTGLASDIHGVFHPFWADSRTGLNQVWTASVFPRAVRPRPTNCPEIGSQLSRRLALVFDPSTYDSASNVVTLPIRLRNVSRTEVCAPVVVEVVSGGGSTHATILNADNHVDWDGARFDYSRAMGDLRCLAPGDVTEAIAWRFRPIAPTYPNQRPRLSVKFRITNTVSPAIR
jgi:hypothetical protein